MNEGGRCSASRSGVWTHTCLFVCLSQEGWVVALSVKPLKERNLTSRISDYYLMCVENWTSVAEKVFWQGLFLTVLGFFIPCPPGRNEPPLGPVHSPQTFWQSGCSRRPWGMEHLCCGAGPSVDLMIKLLKIQWVSVFLLSPFPLLYLVIS